MTDTHAPIIVIGGGLSGLISASLIAKADLPVVLLEKSSTVGGRATTRVKHGFHFNLGPHALYRHGHLRQMLKTLGVDVHGGVPTGNGGFAVAQGRIHTLPVGVTSLISTGLFGVSAKLEFARLQSRLMDVDPRAIQHECLASWLDANVNDTRVRQVLEMLVRVTTFTNDPQHQSAGAAIDQLQLSLRGSVLYLDGGWQTIVNGLRRAAISAGARIVPGAPVIALERQSERTIGAVKLADGTTIRASAAIVCAGPADVDVLTAETAFAATLPPPVRVATLDVGLHSLPKPKRTVALGIDVPLYFSVHSAVARLAPDGAATIHVSKYLRPGETAGPDVEHELDGLMDMMQPGWRDLLEIRQFLPGLTVTNTETTASCGGIGGRPGSRLDLFDNVFVAGDWVGPRGQLSDGCAASAADAAGAAMAIYQARPSRLRATEPAPSCDRTRRRAEDTTVADAVVTAR